MELGGENIYFGKLLIILANSVEKWLNMFVYNDEFMSQWTIDICVLYSYDLRSKC